MAYKFLNRVRMTTATTGTGSMTLGAAVGSAAKGYYQSFAAAGLVDADTVRYTIEDGADWEIGLGTYTASGTILSRDTVMASSNAGAKINLSGTAEVFATLASEDVSALAPKASPTFTGTVVVPDASFTPAKLDNGAAVSVLGRSANSGGVRADIAAAGNDTLFRRVSDALGFGQLTIGMVPDSLITYAKMATAAIATANEYRAGTASKLLNAANVWAAADFVGLTDGTNIALNFASGINFSVTLAGNRTLSNPSNEVVGQTGVIKLNASTSTRTFTLSSEYKVATGVETFPISVATTETVLVSYWIESTSITWITGVFRRT